MESSKVEQTPFNRITGARHQKTPTRRELSPRGLTHSGIVDFGELGHFLQASEDDQLTMPGTREAVWSPTGACIFSFEAELVCSSTSLPSMCAAPTRRQRKHGFKFELGLYCDLAAYSGAMQAGIVMLTII